MCLFATAIVFKLFSLANALKPGSVKKINESKMAFKMVCILQSINQAVSLDSNRLIPDFLSMLSVHQIDVKTSFISIESDIQLLFLFRPDGKYWKFPAFLRVNWNEQDRLIPNS